MIISVSQTGDLRIVDKNLDGLKKDLQTEDNRLVDEGYKNTHVNTWAYWPTTNNIKRNTYDSFLLKNPNYVCIIFFIIISLMY